MVITIQPLSFYLFDLNVRINTKSFINEKSSSVVCLSDNLAYSSHIYSACSWTNERPTFTCLHVPLNHIFKPNTPFANCIHLLHIFFCWDLRAYRLILKSTQEHNEISWLLNLQQINIGLLANSHFTRVSNKSNIELILAYNLYIHCHRLRSNPRMTKSWCFMFGICWS